MPVRPRSPKTGVSLTLAGLLAASGVVAASGASYATNDTPDLTISAIQGSHHGSTHDGDRVRTTGVTTAVDHDGYWIQHPDGDDDPTTSNALYVFTSTDGAKPEVGQTVTVTGEVTEYRPGDPDGANLATTELTDSSFGPAVEELPMPEPVRIGPDGRRAPPQTVDAAADGDARTNIESPDAEFAPDRDALDFYETLEGMLVELRGAEVVGPTNDHGEITVLPAGSSSAHRTPNGGVRYASYDTPNTRRLTLDDALFDEAMPSADVGDSLRGTVAGPLTYDWGTVRVLPRQAPRVEDGNLRRDTAPAAARDELSVATFNVENLDPTDPDQKFAKLARTIVHNLAAPDLVTLEEVQDNTGAECSGGSGECQPDGVTAADKTLDALVRAIQEQGGPAYEWRQISPEYDADGGEPSGNIRNVFLYRTDRGLSLVDRPGGDATTATRVLDRGGRPELSASPGRIDPNNEAFQDSRKPLVGEFDWRGTTVFVIANHFASKGGDEPLTGRFQPPERSSEEQRHGQARVVNDFVREILAVDPRAHVVVAGDINDFEFSRTAKVLSRGPLVDLPAKHRPKADRYSYIYQGNSQILDHILLSRSSYRDMRGYDLVRVNAEFADQVSDHDPQLVRLALG